MAQAASTTVTRTHNRWLALWLFLPFVLVWLPVITGGPSINTLTLGLYGTNAIILVYRFGSFALRVMWLTEADLKWHERIFDYDAVVRLFQFAIDGLTSWVCAIMSVLMAPGVAGGALGSFTAILLSMGIFGFPYMRKRVRKSAKNA